MSPSLTVKHAAAFLYTNVPTQLVHTIQAVNLR